MANNKISGKFGTYYNLGLDETRLPDGPEMVLFLKDKGNVYGTDEGITIPGKHLSAFIVELIRMAQALGVTEPPPESLYKNALAETHFADMGLEEWMK